MEVVLRGLPMGATLILHVGDDEKFREPSDFGGYTDLSAMHRAPTSTVSRGLQHFGGASTIATKIEPT